MPSPHDPRAKQGGESIPVRVAVALETVRALAPVPTLGPEAKAVYTAALAVVAEQLK